MFWETFDQNIDFGELISEFIFKYLYLFFSLLNVVFPVVYDDLKNFKKKNF